jgi:hypothetical protein
MAATKILTVDPGMNTGWAFWQYGKLPNSTGVFRQAREHKKVLPIADQLYSMWEQFRSLLSVTEPEIVIIENANFWAHSAASHAAMFSGDLRKLLFIIGGYCLLCGQAGARWELVEPQRWKGQLDDKALKARIKRRIGREYKQHEQEAVGLGLWRAGTL